MHSLYHALLAQHAQRLTPMRCAEQTFAQLHHYFEDVVLENGLAALVVESLPCVRERPLREVERVLAVSRTALCTFLFIAPEDELNELNSRSGEQELVPTLINYATAVKMRERFIIVADARFSALLVAAQDDENASDQVIWTFEPDVVYTALEYLMARITAERQPQAAAFASAVRRCMPKATSLQLTVSVTTKLARLLQEQTGREIAVNRIATAIRSSLELASVLQTTVDEVGQALGVQHCALQVTSEASEVSKVSDAGEHDEETLITKCYFRKSEAGEYEQTEMIGDLSTYNVRLSTDLNHHVVNGYGSVKSDLSESVHPLIVVPFIYRDRFMGVLMARSDDPQRLWQENEILLMQTVADQVAVAVNHARLFAEIQQQALTDELTGCVNRRSFEKQIVRDIQLATRLRHPLSLVMLDIDHFKHVNDSFGHDAGDAALRMLAEILRQELRVIDTAARYGGEEFALILPQADAEGARLAAERLRAHIEVVTVPGVGHITASFGIATFPVQGSTRDELVSTADRALYQAKHLGRNRVVNASEVRCDSADEMFNLTEGTAQIAPPTHALT